MSDGMKAVDDALERTYAQPAPKPIDYQAANRAFARHKAALTRAKNSGDPQKVIDTVVATVREWNAADYPWPDSWAMWNIALQDAVSDLRGWRDGMTISLTDIR